jgi:nicotinate-nucleotide adenylyltransferase
MKAGILGGTFDPIHTGHLDVARAAHVTLGLDFVVLTPAWRPPHRTAVASAAHRFAMTALASQTEPWLVVSDEEMSPDAPAYTDATLARWHERGHNQANLVFITGADAFAGIRSWHNFPGVLDWCHFAVVARPGYPVATLPKLLPDLAERMVTPESHLPSRPSIILIAADTSPVSSSEVRERLAAGQRIEGAVPAAVAEYIRKHALYGGHRDE